MSDYNIVALQFDQAQQPKFEEKRKDGIVFFGEKNDYPEYLLSLYNESPKHGAIINGKAKYIFGKGFPGKLKANPTETWNQILKKCILDDELFDGYYLQVIWNANKKIAAVYHIEFHKVRINKSGNTYRVKNDWSDNKETARPYPAFNPKDPKGAQILCVNHYNPKSDAYPLPNYFQGLNYIESDIEISRHILGMARQGFVASKLINLNNGEPANEEKEEVERRLIKKFSGHDGKRVVLSFNKSKDNQVEIADLGTTMLTKEDFTNINNLVQQEIYACHEITSPSLFGIKTEGQLGGQKEMREAYEIFKNTYVNDRQQWHEENFNILFQFAGLQADQKLIPVEPVGYSLEEISGLGITIPAKYYYDKLGINPEEYPELMQPAAPAADPASVNENVKNLSGRQNQNLTRIVRQFSRGQLTKEQAASLLKSGFGLSDEEIAVWLIEDDPRLKFEDESVLMHFAGCGESKDDYIVVKSIPFEKDNYYQKETFAEQDSLSKLDANILDLISKDKRITPETIARVLKRDVELIKRIVTGLEQNGYLSPATTRVGSDEVIERTLPKPRSEITDVKPSTTAVILRYSYEGPKDDRNRPFCARLMELNKFYSRSEIETISERLGYSVWDRRGGWWTKPDGEHSPACRHRWVANIVLKKK